MENSLSPYIKDTSVELYNAYKNNKTLLFEGAQGVSLDVDHGIYPYTTSSNTTAGYISTGSGVNFTRVTKVIGVVKSYLSKVGDGYFPSEIHNENAENIRTQGKEYGTTTGRPRRIGWLDLVQVKQAVRVNGLTEIALTKLDILSGLKEVKVCTGYKYKSKIIKEMPSSLTIYRNLQPVYRTLPGWSKINPEPWKDGYSKLPENLQNYVSFIEDEIECPVKIISVGPQRHETIIT